MHSLQKVRPEVTLETLETVGLVDYKETPRPISKFKMTPMVERIILLANKSTEGTWI